MPRPFVSEEARRIRGTAAIAVSLTWLAAAGSIAAIRATQPTPRSVAAYCAGHPLSGMASDARGRVITKVAGMVALLNHPQRRELSANREMQRTYSSLTTAEKERFLQLTIPSAVKAALLAASDCPAPDREAFLNEAFYEMETTFSRDNTAPVNQTRLQAWLYDALRETLLVTPQRARPDIQRAIENNFPAAVKRS